ncbi:S4 domain-containing protein [Accumulibacter sp.]|uniref:S4 domain-containing protein n=1 Tax=Accumulibacter sp. TaxID=2053492 RepID=UPI0025DE403E|nr:S4 domain-containing protein [Accumulibacter sp.]MCM8593824.1 S4 domain-containing protein [Accumulibacter sp.]MDS4047965.1 S4 domain-containing protein [Accumulibacter sp.]
MRAGERPRELLSAELPRLSSLVRQITHCSRREADEWIENGWVAVNGVTVNRLGARASPQATITIDESLRWQRNRPVTVVHHRPVGGAQTASTAGRDPVSALQPDRQWRSEGGTTRLSAAGLHGLSCVADLAEDEVGMTVFTREPGVARLLLGRAPRVEKEYHVRVEGELSAERIEFLQRTLLPGQPGSTVPRVSFLQEDLLRVVVRDNSQRQIQLGCAQVGLRVIEARRVRIGGVALGKVPAGCWRFLRADERF